MHIGMLIPEFPGQTHAFFWREARALSELGAKVTFLSTRRPGEPCLHEFAAAATRQTHYIFPPAVRSLRRLARTAHLADVASYLRSISDPLSQLPRRLALVPLAADLAELAAAERIDHIHAHSCADAAHIVALSRLLGGPKFSLHLHGDLPVYGTHHEEKTRNALFVAAAARSGQEQLISEVGIPADRAFVMRMGVDTSVYSSPVDQTRAEPLHVVTVGRLNRVKGHRFGLQAIRRLIDDGIALRYSIAGSGPHQDEIEAEIRQLGLSQHVSMLGSLSEANVTNLLGTAHVFLLPSIGLGEASPVAVMEAMSAGLCVVCSQIGGTGDMIASGEDGILTPQEDVGAIAAALRRLALDGEERQRMGRAARVRAQRDFDSRVLAQRLLSTIRDLHAR